MRNVNFSSVIGDTNNSLSEQIANHILKKILLRELQQGDRLTESSIAEELEVSNIPVREAFYILENTGMIERLPRKGVRVKAISEQEFQDYTEALIEIFRLGIDYSKKKWSEEKIENLHVHLKQSKSYLKEDKVLEYVVSVYNTCRYVFEVAENKAFIKFYDDITLITNAYSELNWNDIDRTKERYVYLEEMVDFLAAGNYEKAKEYFEVLTRKSLNIK